jgi:hypothetical protein
MQMTKNNQQSTENQAKGTSVRTERRVAASDRRKIQDRRSREERRCDNRLAPSQHPKTVTSWIRSIINARLGVDRRKKVDRRSNKDRRHQQGLESILSKEEIADLLSD